jgi:hypothetical protein
MATMIAWWKVLSVHARHLMFSVVFVVMDYVVQARLWNLLSGLEYISYVRGHAHTSLTRAAQRMVREPRLTVSGSPQIRLPSESV